MYDDDVEEWPWECPDESWRGDDVETSDWRAGAPLAGPSYRALRDQAERDAALDELLGGAAIVDEPDGER
ncbi:MAG: hypothetical protein NVS9B3_03070 [Gemmatimonadaceae bacterium]